MYRFLPLIFFLSLSGSALADFKLKASGGDVTLHVNSFDSSVPTPDLTAELKVKTKRFIKTRAVIKVQGSVHKQKIIVEDAYLDYSPRKKNHVTVGVSKKIIGLEYQEGRRQRLTIYRSPIYRKMEALGLVGRQINFRSRWTIKGEGNRLILEAASGLDGSRDYNSQLSVRQRLGNFSYGGWLLTEAHRIDNGYLAVFAAATSLWYRPPEGSLIFEMFTGKDAQRTEFEKALGAQHQVYFAGSKLEASWVLHLGDRFRLVPLCQASFWFNDFRRPEENTIQMLLGLNFHFGNGASIMLNAEVLGENSLISSQDRSFGRRNFYGALRYAF